MFCDKLDSIGLLVLSVTDSEVARLPLVTAMLTLVANSLRLELQSCEVGAASLGQGCIARPGSDPKQVDSGCGDDMLQVSLRQPAIASAA